MEQDVPYLIVDGHEDLAMGALADGRDYLTSAIAIRAAEAEAGFDNPNGKSMLGMTEWLDGRVAVILATLIAIPRSHANPGEFSYITVQGAHQQALAQLDLYRRWAATSGAIRLIRQAGDLEAVLATWDDDRDASRTVGLMLTMENGDPIRTPDEVEQWAAEGIRVIGPAWHANRYTGDTRAGGPLTGLGRQLLRRMSDLGLVLDIAHMSEEASVEALDTYVGPVVATHAHSRRTADIDRLLSDRLIAGIVAHDGIVGVMPINWALDAAWQPPAGKNAVRLDRVVDAIEAVCDIAGSADYVALGTDFDGGQGAEAAPAELDTVADLPKLVPALAARGFSDPDIASIMSGNWLRLMRKHLPT